MSSDEQEYKDLLTVVKEGLHKGLRVVNIRSKEMYDTVKIKNKIQSHRKNRKRNVNDLGETVFKMYKHNDSFEENEIKNKCNELAKIEREILNFEEELKHVHLNAQKELGKLKAISKPTEED